MQHETRIRQIHYRNVYTRDGGRPFVGELEFIDPAESLKVGRGINALPAGAARFVYRLRITPRAPRGHGQA